MALAYRLSMNTYLDLKPQKMPIVGSCIDLSENVTIHLQFSDSDNEDNVVSSINIFDL